MIIIMKIIEYILLMEECSKNNEPCILTPEQAQTLAKKLREFGLTALAMAENYEQLLRDNSNRTEANVRSNGNQSSSWN